MRTSTGIPEDATSQILLLDGGMGTTLAALGYDTNTPLWGCELLHTDPDAIRKVYQGFRDAGADLIGTATYQLTLSGLMAHLALDGPIAKAVMRSAVSMAAEVCTSSRGPASLPARQRRTDTPGVVLSLGPFGATLSPGQEYDGIYPPPYGPATRPEPEAEGAGGFSRTSGRPLNAFPPTTPGPQDEERSIQVLMEWHLERLRVYAEDQDTWRRVEWVAFETVPLLREIRAVRRAMARIQRELRQRYGEGGGQTERQGKAWWDKKFWVTSPFPGGKHPQQVFRQGNERTAASASEFIDTLLKTSLDEARPDGIGVNCTNPAYLPGLLEDLTNQVAQHISEEHPNWPTLVVYPDGGAVYDVHSRTWTDRTFDAPEWAETVGSQAIGLAVSRQGAEQGHVWGGVIVGGCCKTGFKEIGGLRQYLDSQ